MFIIIKTWFQEVKICLLELIHSVMGSSAAFYLLLSLVGSLGFSIVFSPDTYATVINNGYFAESTIYSRSNNANGTWYQSYTSNDVGGPVIDLELSNGSGEIYEYLGHISYEQPQITCSNNSIFLYNVYTIFADNVHVLQGYTPSVGGNGLGPAFYNTSYYGSSYYRSNFVEEDSQTGRGFAYGVYIAGRDKPQSNNSTFAGLYEFTANFGFYPYNASGLGSDPVPIDLEILGINSFCSQEDAEDFVDNYIFQNTRPEVPDDDTPIISDDFPYSYNSGDSENNQELYNGIVSQNPAVYEPQIGDAQTILNWFVQFVGGLATIPQDPHDYRCNVSFYPNTSNMIGFDWNENNSYGDIRFNACDNEFVYAMNNSNSIIGRSSGLSNVQEPGAGNMFFVSLKGILWLACFLMIFKMLQNFYYYVYEIISYSFGAMGSVPEGGV